MTFEEITAGWSRLWLPPEDLPLSQWAEKHFFLSPEYSNRTGQLILFGWQRQILDSFTDPTVQEIDLLCGTQMIKTLFIQVATAYVIAKTPAPILISQPKESDAEQFSKERIEPMMRDCPCLSVKFGTIKSRDRANTTLFKKFPGGSVSLVGAGAPGNAARRSICYAFIDEEDKYPANVGGEGDFGRLIEERLATYGTRAKSVHACSPTRKHSSKIGQRYADSDQREPWVKCHACGGEQVLRWHHVHWDNTLPREERAQTAHIECEHCGTHWNDIQRWAACDRAEFRARKPFRGKAGFWISHLYSPWKTLAKIVDDFLTAKDAGRDSLQTFVNTNLAELWEEEGETPNHEILMGRVEKYPFGSEPAVPNDTAVVPQRALFLTAFVDVQEDRLEYEVVGWGRGKESWSVAYGVIRVMEPGTNRTLSTANPLVWAELEKVLALEWKHESGQTMPIIVMGVDTGFRPKPVYEFAKRHPQPAYGPAGLKVFAPRTVVPTKGSSTETLRLIAAVSKEDAARKRQGVRIVSIGTGVAKQELYDNLRMPRPGDGCAAPGYCHFPEYGPDYFVGLCNEKRVLHNDGSVSWEKLGRNEPLDCRVGNRAVAAVFGVDRFGESQWRMLEEQLGLAPGSTVAPIAEPAKPDGVEAGTAVPAPARRYAPARRKYGVIARVRF